MPDAVWSIVEEAIRHLGFVQGIALALVVVLLLAGVGAVWRGIRSLPAPPPYRPVDNSPGSDGSAPGDVHDGGQGNLTTDPSMPGGYPGGGGG